MFEEYMKVIKISTDDSSEDTEDEVDFPDVMKVKVDLDHIVATGPRGALQGSYDDLVYMMGKTSVNYNIFVEEFATSKISSMYFFPSFLKRKIEKLGKEINLKLCVIVIFKRDESESETDGNSDDSSSSSSSSSDEDHVKVTDYIILCSLKRSILNYFSESINL